jgi:hypothetical protein
MPTRPRRAYSDRMSKGRSAPLVALASLAACLLLAGRARADVYEGRAESEAPQQPPSFTPEPPIEQQALYPHVFGVRYDSSAGALTVYVGFFGPEYWASNLSEAQASDLARFALASTCEAASDSVQLGSEPEKEETAELRGHVGTSAGELTERGYNGALSVPVTYANGVYTMTATNTALAGLALRCVAYPASEPRIVNVLELADVTPHVTPAHKTCGTLGFKGQSLRVEVSKGRASCSETRRVLRKLYTSNQRGRAHGTHHNPPRDLSETYWLVDGWKCVVGAGGGSCARGRTNQITGQWQA